MSDSVTPPSGEPVFFVDRNLGTIDVPSALRDAGCRVELHDDHFLPNTPDVEWLEAVGKKGWVVLTKDRRFRTRPLELVALLNAGIHVFVLREKKLNGVQQANAFRSALDEMKMLVSGTSPPMIAVVTASGKVKEVEGRNALLARLTP